MNDKATYYEIKAFGRFYAVSSVILCYYKYREEKRKRMEKSVFIDNKKYL